MEDTQQHAGIEAEDLALGERDMIEEIPPELYRVMVHNSRELERLPGQRLVNVPRNEG